MAQEVTEKFILLKDLPMYPADTIVIHKYDLQPSRYRPELYATDGVWETEDGVRVPMFVEAIIKWCSKSQRSDDNHAEWVERIDFKAREDMTHVTQ
jgi:hypothetical protein